MKKTTSEMTIKVKRHAKFDEAVVQILGADVYILY